MRFNASLALAICFGILSRADALAQFKNDLAPQVFAARAHSFQERLARSSRLARASSPSLLQRDFSHHDALYRDSLDAQTPPRALKLLPDNLTIFESVFWGSGGVFRGFSPLTPESRRRELEFRRAMLTTHQVLGFATLGLMSASVIFGQILLNDYEALRFEDALRNRQTHRTISIVTFGSYMSTAAMSIFAPPPLIRRDEWNTVTTHRLFAVIHLAGMIAQPILAISAANSRDFEQIRALRRAHQILGYVTLAALSAAMLVITF